MGYIGISTSLGILFAPLLGGLVYAHSGYYVVFAMAFELITMDIVLRLAVIEKSVAVTLRGKATDTNPDYRTAVPYVNAQADTPLADLEDAIVPAPAIPQGALRPIQTRDSNIQTDIKKSPLKILLKSRRFLTGLWGAIVQAILLTAFDSVRL